jgi:SAM-dependent methyltransferase
MLEHTITVGDYLAGVVGYAALRDLFRAPHELVTRSTEMRNILEHADDPPFDIPLRIAEHSVVDGYTRWAPHYDGEENPAILAEEQVMVPRFAALDHGDALDAACGTGRHSARLAGLGHRVVGVDLTPAMLDRARARVPTAEFRLGSLEALPVAAGSVDLVTSALALCHVTDLAPVAVEFARAARPGGRVLVSDIHPSATSTGGAAVFPTGDGTLGIPFVRNNPHLVSDYLRAFRDAGLEFVDLTEVRLPDDAVRVLPSYQVLPEATTRAFAGNPVIAVFEWVKPRA